MNRKNILLAFNSYIFIEYISMQRMFLLGFSWEIWLIWCKNKKKANFSPKNWLRLGEIKKKNMLFIFYTFFSIDLRRKITLKVNVKCVERKRIKHDISDINFFPFPLDAFEIYFLRYFVHWNTHFRYISMFCGTKKLFYRIIPMCIYKKYIII